MLTSFLIRKNRHAEGKRIKNHAKIDDFSSQIPADIHTRKIDTPKVNESKSTPKSTIFVEIGAEIEARKNRHAAA